MSSSLNKCFFIGNLVRDPEVRHTNTGKTVAKFTIAVNGYNDTVQYPRIVAWQKTAEIAGEYLSKGAKVMVECRMEISTYDKDGITMYATDFIVENLQMLGSKGDKNETKQEAVNEEASSEIPF